jgi:hypothetical protein
MAAFSVRSMSDCPRFMGLIRAMIAMRAQGVALRPIATAMAERGFRISHEAVKQVVAAHSA